MTRPLSIAACLTLGLAALTLAGCGDKDPGDSNDSSSADDTESSSDDTDDSGDADTDSDADSDTDTDADADPLATFVGTMSFSADATTSAECVVLWDLLGEPSSKNCPNCTFQFQADLTLNAGSNLPGTSYCDDVNSFLGDLGANGELFLGSGPYGSNGDTALAYYYYSAMYSGFYGLLEQYTDPALVDGGTAFSFSFDYSGYSGQSEFLYYGYY